MGTDKERKIKRNLMDRQQTFARYHPRLQAIAYQMLGI